MSTFAYAREQAEFDRSIAIRSPSTMEPFDYLQAHLVPVPPPETLPAPEGWQITLFEPTPEQLDANDWERA